MGDATDQIQWHYIPLSEAKGLDILCNICRKNRGAVARLNSRLVLGPADEQPPLHELIVCPSCAENWSAGQVITTSEIENRRRRAEA